VQLWRKNGQGHWELVADRSDGEFHLETIGLTVTSDEIYEDVEFEPGTGRK
jgi:Uma2 family endonuclease